MTSIPTSSSSSAPVSGTSIVVTTSTRNPGLTLVLAKVEDLHHGEVVAASGSGFVDDRIPSGAVRPTIGIYQCTAAGRCIPAGLLQPIGSGGDVAGTVLLARLIFDVGQVVDCALETSPCVIGLSGGRAGVPLRFASDPPPELPALTVSPSGALLDGQPTRITASGLPPFGQASIAWCASGWKVLDSIPLDGVPCIAVGGIGNSTAAENDNGARTITASVPRLLPVSGSSFDCGERPGRCSLLLVYQEIVITKIDETVS